MDFFQRQGGQFILKITPITGQYFLIFLVERYLKVESYKFQASEEAIDGKSVPFRSLLCFLGCDAPMNQTSY